MKVLFFIGSLKGVGGVERATVNLLNGLSEIDSIDVTLVVFDAALNPFFKIDNNIKVMSLNVYNYKKDFFKIFFRLNSILKNDFDVVLTVETMSLLFMFIPWLFHKNKIKLVVWEHFNFRNDNGRKLRGFFRLLAAKYADLIVLLTERDKSEWLSNISVKSRITHIYNINPFNVDSNRYDLGSRNIVSVGRFAKVKGFDRLIKIWKIFQENYECPEWNLKIVGYGEEGDNLKNIITELGVSNISLISADNIAQIYKEASFFCMTSYFEGLPMVLIESQAFGLPAISFDIFTGPSEILIDNSGVIIPDGDLMLYAEAIYKLVSNDMLREQMSQNAFHSKNRFSKESIISKWVSELEITSKS